MIKNINISLHKHKSVKSIIYDWYGLEKNAPLNTEVCLKHITYSNKYVTVQEAINLVKEKHHWGFARHDPEEIHIWVDNKLCTYEQILNLIGHELAHAAGYKKESDAITIGAIVNFSNLLLKQNFRNLLKFWSGVK